MTHIYQKKRTNPTCLSVLAPPTPSTMTTTRVIQPINHYKAKQTIPLGLEYPIFRQNLQIIKIALALISKGYFLIYLLIRANAIPTIMLCLVNRLVSIGNKFHDRTMHIWNHCCRSNTNRNKRKNFRTRMRNL